MAGREGSRIKAALGNSGLATLFIYISLTPISVLYFNWQFAREHGFVRWLAYGDFVATVQGAIWPYYVVAGWNQSGGQSRIGDLQHYLNSQKACNEAMKLIIRFGGTQELPEKEKSDVIQLLRAAVTEADAVHSGYLDRVHPEFLRRYQQEYIPALRVLAEGLRDDNTIKQMGSAWAYNRYIEWVNAHSSELNLE